MASGLWPTSSHTRPAGAPATNLDEVVGSPVVGTLVPRLKKSGRGSHHKDLKPGQGVSVRQASQR